MEAGHPQRSLRYMLHVFDILDNEGGRPYTDRDSVRDWFGQGTEDSGLSDT